MGVVIIGTGKSLPELKVDNTHLSKMVETDNQWIIDRTGIESRHIATKETGLDLAVNSAKEAMGDLDRNSIGLVIVATVSPDMLVPSMGALVKRAMNLENAIAYDLNAACSGFIYGIWNAEALMKTHGIKRALVIGVERLSRITNWEDRGTCIIFGDGAGSAVLELKDDKTGIISSFIKNYDDISNSLTADMQYLKTPFADDEPKEQFLHMNGPQVFRFAVGAIGEAMDIVLQKAGITANDVKYYVPHQANMRIIQSAAQRMKQPIEKFQVNIQTTGNVSAASIPMALADLMKSGKVNSGDIIMMVGFGGGLSAGAILFEAV
ncbi:MAG: ketoacyl-ACP synthase III [Eubacteriales bacterium]|nr:ketoacyl-ACP synthase III [Eubacteriales bacterium]MDD3199195.1 ketoacyl-ACP synthase III [Eubacteriales bacterium]MDD4121797.1 ketoacyl-ACP synthase III [Eubacteriales bacterium]MDD4629150.1 ketoacyl-ACP synthase III [Eubacteriales bacterium]